MMRTIGIDEAGLGPTLGPLCYGWAVSNPLVANSLDDCQKRCLEKLGDDAHLIQDSKKLYQGSRKEEKLERAKRAIVALFSKNQKIFHSFPLNALGGFENNPMYQDLLIDQLIADENELEIHQESPLSFGGTSICLEGEMNAEFANGYNKSQVAWAKIIKIIQFCLDKYPSENLRFLIDRQGGRQFYEEEISAIFPFQPITTLEEGVEQSIYLLEIEGRQIEWGFYKKGEDKHLLIAMASLLAKWTREKLMHAFNSYWEKYNNAVAFTAGYPQDAKRYIEEMLPAFQKSQIPIESIIRNR